MIKNKGLTRIAAMLAVGASMLVVATAASAQTPAPPPPPPSTRAAAATGTWAETSTEVRMQLDFHVPDAALAAYIPAGFTVNVATQGAAARANIRVIFIDRIGVTGPDNRVLGTGMNRLVFLAVPVRETASNTTAQMIIGGITSDPADVPGPFGNYLLASDHHMVRTNSADASGVSGSEDWHFQAASGEYVTFKVDYTRVAVNRGTPDTRFFSGTNPSYMELNRINQGLDIAWNATTLVDRAGEPTWDAGGGSWDALFDGTEELLSIDVIGWYEREIYRP